MPLAEAAAPQETAGFGHMIVWWIVGGYLLISAAYLAHHAFMEQTTLFTRVRRFAMAIGCVVLIVFFTRFWF